MSTLESSFWTPLDTSTAPFSPFNPSLPHSQAPDTQLGFPHSTMDPWTSSGGTFVPGVPLLNEQSTYRAPRSEPIQPRYTSQSSRQMVFAHREYIDASFTGDNTTSPMSLDPLHSTGDISNFRAAMRSRSLVSSSATAPDLLGPQTGHSTHTDPGFTWASDDNPSIRDPSLQSYSAQSLSPALSNDQNLLASPKQEHEDSDSSNKRSPSTSRKKPRRKTHNAIEKRYRVKLNEKIAELRDSIPSLRQQAATTPGGSPIGESSAGDPAAGQKINKANILEKATEYVKHLESCNRRLQSELHRARTEAGSRCQHPSHVMPQPAYTGPEGRQGPIYSYDTGPPRQGQVDGFYSVEDLFADDVRQV